MATALLLTVGTGNVDDLERSLLVPMRLSMGRGEWSRIVLLPSTVTREVSDRLAEEFGPRLEIDPLPAAELENDADACFRHFEATIERLRREGFAAGQILVDFTRGTKAMSAALVLAAVAHGLPRMRYIAGDRDARGMVVAGTERIHETTPFVALSLRRVEQARGLVERGAFGAALDVLPDPESPFAALDGVVAPDALFGMRTLAAFLAAWDRLNYAAAAGMDLPPAETLPAAWRPLRPGADLVEWVRALARQPARDDHAAMAAWLRRLAVDLLANAERRIGHAHFEDALVRAYRVLELIGQIRLFDRGIDSERVPGDHPDVVALRRRLGRSTDFGTTPQGGLTAPRELAARLLKQMGDPVGPHLLEIARSRTELQVKARNLSVLNHGFEARAPTDPAGWRALFDELWDLLTADRGEPNAFEADRRTVTFPPPAS